VCDYLDSLEWDGSPRLDKWLVTYAGAEDSSYVRAVGPLTLIAAVRRVRWPGAKFDELPVLESPTQGTDKSTAIRILAVKDDWFTDYLPLNAEPKVVIERTCGKWIIEAGELSGMRRGDIDKLKGLLSRSADRGRLAYAKFPSEVPRQFIAIGTTNNREYLKDQTNRRFWPVRRFRRFKRN
jgi:predicted P-loop ATPase